MRHSFAEVSSNTCTQRLIQRSTEGIGMDFSPGNISDVDLNGLHVTQFKANRQDHFHVLLLRFVDRDVRCDMLILTNKREVMCSTPCRYVCLLFLLEAHKCGHLKVTCTVSTECSQNWLKLDTKIFPFSIKIIF